MLGDDVIVSSFVFEIKMLAIVGVVVALKCSIVDD